MAKSDFLNPFTAGVSYKEFLEAVGKQTIAEYCKGNLGQEQIDWLEKEISLIKNKK